MITRIISVTRLHGKADTSVNKELLKQYAKHLHRNTTEYSTLIMFDDTVRHKLSSNDFNNAEKVIAIK